MIKNHRNEVIILETLVRYMHVWLYINYLYSMFAYTQNTLVEKGWYTELCYTDTWNTKY